MKHSMEMLCGLQYKLWMMFPCWHHHISMVITCLLFTIHNDQNRHSCYHAMCKSVVMGKSRTSHIPTNENLADLMTNIIMCHPKRASLIDKLLYIFMNGTITMPMVTIQNEFESSMVPLLHNIKIQPHLCDILMI